MKRIGLVIGFLALLIAVLPTVTAQDEKKKDDAKAAKKDAAKKDEPKDDEKKSEEKKKPEPKKVEKIKLSYGASFRTKIISINVDNSSEFTIEVQEIDPVKVQQVNIWMVQQQASLTQQLFNAQRQQNVAGRFQAMANYNQALANFQYQKAQKSIYSPKNLDVKAAENARVRTNFLAQEFDDAGFPKKWTRKEIEARKDKTGLPGFPADFGVIKSGQYIDIYMAKVAPTKPMPRKKRGPDDDDVPAAKKRPEYVMIVVVGEPMMK